MYIEVEFLAISISAVVTNVLFNSIMNFEVFLKVALLCKAHSAALLVAHERLILGVATEMGEVLAQGTDNARAAVEMTSEYFKLTFGIGALNVVDGVIVRRRYVLVHVFKKELFVVVSTRNLGGLPVGLDLVLGEKLFGEKFLAAQVLKVEQFVDIGVSLVNGTILRVDEARLITGLGVLSAALVVGVLVNGRRFGLGLLFMVVLAEVDVFGVVVLAELFFSF